MPSPEMKPALSQVCSLISPFQDDIADYAAGQCAAIEVWLTKLESYLESNSTGDVKRLVARHGVTTPVASFQGGVLTSQGDARHEAWRLLRRRLDLCAEIGIDTLVVAADIAGPLTPQVIERVRHSLGQLALEAGRRKVRIALEFQSRAAFCNNLQTAVALATEVASPHLGICLDVFHSTLR